MNSKSSNMDMLSGPLLKKIIVFSLPIAASSMLQQLFNSADVAVVGRFSGNLSLAAVGSNTPIINLIINIFIGLSLGANVLISTLIGKGHKNDIKDAVHTVMALSLIVGFSLIFIGIATSGKLLELVHTPSDVMPLASLYLKIFFIGMPFFMFGNFGAAVLRSHGDTKRPLYALIISGIANVILNLLFVIKLNMDVAGVALATLIANFITAVYTFHFMRHEPEEFRIEVKKLCIRKSHLLKVIKIGLPAGLQGFFFSLSNICIQGALNSYGKDAMAGSAAALNYEFYTYFIINGFNQACVTFTSQNFGAGNLSRCRKVFLISTACSFAASIAACESFVIFRSLFIGFYTKDPDAFLFAAKRIVCIESFGFLPSSYEIMCAYMRGLGYSILPALIVLFGSCAFRIIWIYTFYAINPTFEGLMYLYPISWALTAVFAIISLAVIEKKMKKSRLSI